MVEEEGTRCGTLGHRCPTLVASPWELPLRWLGSAVLTAGPISGRVGTKGGGAPRRGDTLQEGCPRCQKLSEATSPSGRAVPLNVMPIICPSSFLDGSPLLHSTSSRCGKPSWPWWPCAGWLDPGQGLHAGKMRLHYGAKSSKGHGEVWAGGTLTLGEDGIPGLDVVPPRLDVEVAEEGGWQVEHG